MYVDGKFSGRWSFYQAMALRKEPGFATQCIGCGKCESHCPQHLNIIEELKNADRALRPAYVRPILHAASKFVNHKNR